MDQTEIQPFKVKVGEFEGPLDLLLNLIERRKMHISQISLAQVADDYVEHLHGENGQSMGAMANFILVASTLMLIKSLALLPNLQISEEESGNIVELENRLKRLLQIRALSQHLQDHFGKPLIWSPVSRPGRAKTPVFTATAEINLTRFSLIIKTVLQNLPQPEVLPEKIIRQIISLETVIAQLASRVERALKISFRDFVQDKKDKLNIIVSFLGMLELVKQGAIKIEQEAQFGDINMESRTVGIPYY